MHIDPETGGSMEYLELHSVRRACCPGSCLLSPSCSLTPARAIHPEGLTEPGTASPHTSSQAANGGSCGSWLAGGGSEDCTC